MNAANILTQKNYKNEMMNKYNPLILIQFHYYDGLQVQNIKYDQKL